MMEIAPWHSSEQHSHDPSEKLRDDWCNPTMIPNPPHPTDAPMRWQYAQALDPTRAIDQRANGYADQRASNPTNAPTSAPTSAPTNAPTDAPTSAPTGRAPKESLTNPPSGAPTRALTSAPTGASIIAPTTQSLTDAPTTLASTQGQTDAFQTGEPTETSTEAPTMEDGDMTVTRDDGDPVVPTPRSSTDPEVNEMKVKIRIPKEILKKVRKIVKETKDKAAEDCKTPLQQVSDGHKERT
jgi:hypothetical protein